MAVREANVQKVPVYQADLTRIQEAFMTAVKEVKREVGSDLTAAKAPSKEAAEEMFSTLTKGQDMLKPHITPEDIADAVTDKIAAVDGVNQEALDNFNQALLVLMQTMVQSDDKHDE